MASTSEGVNSHFADTSKLISELENQMQCAICQERLKKPRVLACLHSFCEECLKRSHRLAMETFVDSDSETEEADFPIIKCAYCREITELPESGITGLKADFRANKVGEILDALETRKRNFVESEYTCNVCSSCGESPSVPASDYCQNCGQFFCEQCSRVHQKLTNTKDHLVLGISDLMTGKTKLRKTEHEDVTYKMCPQHSGEHLKSFCRVCKKPVCFFCTSFGKCISHKSEVCALDEAVTEMTGIVEMLSDQLKHRQRTIDDVLSKSNHVIATTESRKNASIQQMIAKHHAVIRQFNIKTQQAVSNRESLFNSKVNSVQGIVADIQKMKKVSDKVLLLADDVLKGVDVHGIDLATLYGCLQEVLQSVTLGQVNAMDRNLSKVEEDVLQIPGPYLSISPAAEGALAKHQSDSRLIPGTQNNRIQFGSNNQQVHEVPKISTPSSLQFDSQLNQVGGHQTAFQPPPSSPISGPGPRRVSGLPTPQRCPQHIGPRSLGQSSLRPRGLSNYSHPAQTAPPPTVGYSGPQSTIRLSSSSSISVPPLTSDLPAHRSPSNSVINPVNGLSAVPTQTLNVSTTVSSCRCSANSSASTSYTRTNQLLFNEQPVPELGSVSTSTREPCASLPTRSLSSVSQILETTLAEIGDLPDLGPNLSLLQP